MKNKKEINIRKMTTVGILGAVSIMLGMTPLGFIPVGPTKATIMHIPVIIGAIAEGPVVGGTVGLIFGLFSIFNAVTNPTPISPIFYNPIVSVLPRVLIGVVSYYVYNFSKKLGDKKISVFLNVVWIAIMFYLGYGIYGNIINKEGIGMLLINILLISLTLGMGILGRKKFKVKAIDVVLATIAGTLINTVGVLSSIYFIYGERYVELLGKDPAMARKIIFGIGVANGIPEIIIGIIVVTNVMVALQGRAK